ncbi:MAG: hypothetical protein IJ091_01265 [Oscillospiraceae bacterium]|nr:hypothetical protein [Oscillospiraceae bacterium]
MWKKYRNMAYMGIFGAILFAAGDLLIYLYPGLTLENEIQPLWAEMPAYRFIASAWCGIFGGMIMMFGAFSAYTAIKNELGKRAGMVSVLGIAGAVLAAFAHFVLGSLLPITYKNALAEGASAEQAARMCMRWTSYMTIPDVFMILLLYLPLLLVLYMTICGKYGIPRKTILINAGFALLVVVLQIVLRNWKWSGILGTTESLFEGCVYINLVIYWNRKMT